MPPSESLLFAPLFAFRFGMACLGVFFGLVSCYALFCVLRIIARRMGREGSLFPGCLSV